ncbi:MAG: hypothetical protein E7311_02660 [Clostridiales bacterium]|nr:hypothetical protein [Clostridiales bacterium]
MKRIKFVIAINIIIMFFNVFFINNNYAKPSDVILLLQDEDFNDVEYYIVDAEENEIPKGFHKDGLIGLEKYVEAYKNGPLTIVKISDENYNYKFVAVNENFNCKLYTFHVQEIDNINYYVIPYMFEGLQEQCPYELHVYNTMLGSDVVKAYTRDWASSDYDKKIVFSINENGDFALLSYQNGKFVMFDSFTEKNEDVIEKNEDIIENNIIKNEQEDFSAKTYYSNKIILSLVIMLLVLCFINIIVMRKIIKK